MLRYVLLLRYTSIQAYTLLLKQFPLPSLSLLKKLTEGGIEPLKAAKVLLEQGKIGTHVVLLLGEVYLQKDSQYQDGKLVGADNEGKLYKGVMTFMINNLKKSLFFVIKAIPEINSERNGVQKTVIIASYLLTVLGLMYVQLFQIITQPIF